MSSIPTHLELFSMLVLENRTFAERETYTALSLSLSFPFPFPFPFLLGSSVRNQATSVPKAHSEDLGAYDYFCSSGIFELSASRPREKTDQAQRSSGLQDSSNVSVPEGRFADHLNEVALCGSLGRTRSIDCHGVEFLLLTDSRSLLVNFERPSSCNSG